MGRRTLDKERELDPQVRNSYFERLLPLFIEKGMSAHSMDDIAQYLGISKATFYRHFRSRDELFGMFMDYIVGQILSARQFLHDPNLRYEERLLSAFAAILQQIEGIGFVLLADLRGNFPELWQKVRETYAIWEEELRDFFSEGIRHGHLHPVHPGILAHMVVLFSRELMRPEYLQSLNMTLGEAFGEMFKIQVRGILRNPEFYPEAIEARMSALLPEIKKHLVAGSEKHEDSARAFEAKQGS
ncbi:MAG: TetR/AcrR family transcriptional regulator [Turneriella sp.]|nr:TetR/AcrR family transcriptional regulator [Leptospiraceae bacterium]MCX7631925.1 TetR/AcrR family transcriptional regulator [Turneriella sp.]